MKKFRKTQVTPAQPILSNFIEAVQEAQETASDVIQVSEHLFAFLAKLRATQHVCLDTETTAVAPKLDGVKFPALHRKHSILGGMSFCLIPDKYAHLLTDPYDELTQEHLEAFEELVNYTYYIPFVADQYDKVLSKEMVLNELRPILADSSKTWYFHGWRFDNGVLLENGLNLAGEWNCSLIETWLTDPRIEKDGFGHKLKTRFSKDILPHVLSVFRGRVDEWSRAFNQTETNEDVHVDTFQDVAGDEKDITKIPLSQSATYAKDDAWFTACLHMFYLPKFQKGNQAILYQFEKKKAQVGCDIEGRGIAINQEHFWEMRRQLEPEADALAEQLFEKFGTRDIKLTSPKAVCEAMFDKMGLPMTHGRAVNKSVMLPLAREGYDICKLYVDFNAKMQILKTFLVPFTGKDIVVDGRLYFRINPQGTETGRWSSQWPNFQNIPRGKIREGFIAPDGRVLIDGDLSQIELRIMAHVSKDPMLLDAYKNGMDIHSRTAAGVISKATGNPMTEEQLVALIKRGENGDKSPEVLKAKEYRQLAKPVNFGLIYGMYPRKLQEYLANDFELYIPIEEAEAIRNAYFEMYKGVADWHIQQEKKARENGYVSTLYGRKRPLPNINDTDINENNYSAASRSSVRMAYNSPIQGTAGDIISLNIVKLAQLGFFVIGQVHDEVLIECDESDAEAQVAIIKDVMCHTAKLDVPIDSSVAYGKNWGEIH